MIDISALKKGDRMIFSNGHESPVLKVEEDSISLYINFVAEGKQKVCLFFTKNTGIARETDYEIVKIIHA